MNILHITYTFEEGGVDTLLLEMLPYILRQGVNVDLLVLKKNKTILSEQIERYGIRVLNGKYSNIYDIRNIMYIRNKMKHYDIVHCHLFPIQYFVSIASMLLKQSPPILLTTEHCTTNRRRGLYLIRPLERYMYSMYDRIICISEAAANNLIQWIGYDDKIIWIDNGIYLPRILNTPPLKKNDIGISSNSIVIMMVARFFHQKDHKTAIRAMKHLPNKYKLVFVGSGILLEDCKKYVNDNDLNDRVVFLGNRNDVPALIKCADIGLLSSTFEGLPISLLEFCAAGIPIVGTNIDGIRELVNNDDLLFDMGDDVGLSKCIINLSIPEVYRVASEYNLKKSKDYTIEKTAGLYFSVYKNLYDNKKK